MAAMVMNGATAEARDVPARRRRSESGAAEQRFRDGLRERSLQRKGAATWSSSLSDGDLACLLQVIESQVLPRMLRDYRPSHHAPLKASTVD